eukprot:365718-Chlamydomonas_euryale.AAC.13
MHWFPRVRKQVQSGGSTQSGGKTAVTAAAAAATLAGGGTAGEHGTASGAQTACAAARPAVQQRSQDNQIRAATAMRALGSGANGNPRQRDHRRTAVLTCWRCFWWTGKESPRL